MSHVATLVLGAIHLPSQLNPTVASKQLTTVSGVKGGVGFGVMDVLGNGFPMAANIRI